MRKASNIFWTYFRSLFSLALIRDKAWLTVEYRTPKTDPISLNRDRQIRLMHQAGIHVEVTTLLIPGFNDGEGELAQLADK